MRFSSGTRTSTTPANLPGKPHRTALEPGSAMGRDRVGDRIDKAGTVVADEGENERRCHGRPPDGATVIQAWERYRGKRSETTSARLRRWPLEDGAMDCCNAQIAAIPGRGPTGHQSDPSPPFEYWLAASIGSMAPQHITSALTGFCAMPHDVRRVRHERDPENCGDPGCRCRRLQPARGSGRRSNLVAAARVAQRSDRSRDRRASWAHRQAHRRRQPHRVPQRRRRGALRGRNSARPDRAQRRHCRPTAASNFASAFISATSSRRATAI